jgi:fumarate reductase iron-sulfur subunit
VEINIKRDNTTQSFNIERASTLLEALYSIKTKQDSTLTFDSGCKSGICGCCSVLVNGKEKLACTHKLEDNDTIEPLKHYKVKKDLLVDKSAQLSLIKQTNAALANYKQELLTTKDENLTKIQTDCILCSSCYSACPVIDVNSNFLGPFALTRAYRYTADKREENPKDIIDSIQTNGVWDCTLCGECTLACPMGIDPKGDIVQLRNQSAKFGYMDPNFSNIGFGDGFGFNGGF